ncbi:MAG: iron-containing alcohol dehydrogenase [Spirochaetia bacterium]|nr:iron-containing alcohol dehydrogenase [Spirochaetia bacterium]
MISSLLSSVHLLSYDEIDGSSLFTILSYAAKKEEKLNVCVVLDDAPIAAKEILIEQLKNYCTISVFDKVRPNPQTKDIMLMVQDERFGACDAVLGIGGGSVLDSAKAMAMLATNKGSLDQYLGSQPSMTIQKASLPLVLIPTTAGTGSEMTKVGVYTDDTGRKYTLGSPLMHAHTALLVASLLDTMPPALCAATGLDALDHALESIWNKNSNAITASCARSAAIKILQVLPKLYDAPKEERRALQRAMLEAASEAGIAFNLTGTASGHAISFVLSESWHIPHGLSCAFTLLEVYDWALQDQENRKQLSLISKHFHPELLQEDELVQALRSDLASLLDHLNIPRTFKELSVEMDKDAIEQEFCRALNDPKLHNQKPPLDAKSLYAMLEAKR